MQKSKGYWFNIWKHGEFAFVDKNPFDNGVNGGIYTDYLHEVWNLFFDLKADTVERYWQKRRACQLPFRYGVELPTRYCETFEEFWNLHKNGDGVW